MLTEEQTKDLLKTLTELGGRGFKEEDIVYEGMKIQLPESHRGNLDKTITELRRKQKEEAEVSTFTKTYNYRPMDGAVCAFRAMKKVFGMVSGQAIRTLFGDIPPEYINVPISSTQTEEVPWGEFIVPFLENTTFRFGSSENDDYGSVFQVMIQSPRKNRFAIEGVFKIIEEELKTNSIYRGKAIDGQEQPNFLDLHGVDPNKVIYSEQVQADLDANIWAVIKYAATQREFRLPLKRAVLLIGQYGTGKTLAAFLTALIAEANGFTFIMARPGRDDFGAVMQTARLYQPAIVFMEDAESLTAAEATDSVSQVLDIFDGVQAKGQELMVVLTTNHPEMLHKGMMRPGRVDAVIEIGPLDGPGIERLIRSNIDPRMLDPRVDFEKVIAACEDYVPAFVKEAADRAIRYAIARTQGEVKEHSIGTDDLVKAAESLRPQFKRMTEAPEEVEKEPVGVALARMIMTGNKQALADLVSSTPRADVWSQKEVKELKKAVHSNGS